uniref:Uncharacterized protein n=1 Tax=Arcella intermedia TaxID=1963864 RepID=A0A6B2L9S7_9EUKA
MFLHGNDIGDEGATAIMKALTERPMRVLNLSGNRISPDVISLIRSKLSKIPLLDLEPQRSSSSSLYNLNRILPKIEPFIPQPPEDNPIKISVSIPQNPSLQEKKPKKKFKLTNITSNINNMNASTIGSSNYEEMLKGMLNVPRKPSLKHNQKPIQRSKSQPFAFLSNNEGKDSSKLQGSKENTISSLLLRNQQMIAKLEETQSKKESELMLISKKLEELNIYDLEKSALEIQLNHINKILYNSEKKLENSSQVLLKTREDISNLSVLLESNYKTIQTLQLQLQQKRPSC